MTVQAAHGQILVDMLDELRAFWANLAHLRCSPSPPPFDDGFWLPFGIPSQKGGVHFDTCRWRYIVILCFLFHCSLIYIYELFMIYVFVLCFVKSRNYFCFTCIFYTCVYVFVEYFRKYTGWFSCAAVYTCNWWIVVRLDYFVMCIIFVKGFYL